MIIYKTVEDSKLCLAPMGRLDASTTPELENEFNKSLANVKELVLDFKDVEYISSAGLRALLKAHRTMCEQGIMRITGSTAMIREVFNITGFSDIFNVE